MAMVLWLASPAGDQVVNACDGAERAGHPRPALLVWNLFPVLSYG